MHFPVVGEQPSSTKHENGRDLCEKHYSLCLVHVIDDDQQNLSCPAYRPVARFLSLGGKYIFRGKDFVFIISKQISSGSTKFGGLQKIGRTARKFPK